ncbi:hypothetical protein [Psychromicrobium lacuslunae]|uniref:DUF3137 domain-containing protein n=1 Tax=Psychromicrobium lacuslunae TaxID=1618207 RepID=A0A0D4C0S7_9MICC|nr:hypothetical protein [Psychromicrobium lacuslunae]AJT42188.1 hypothetical protein UM93_12985 [Psychromicrobium lacuslunae]
MAALRFDITALLAPIDPQLASVEAEQLILKYAGRHGRAWNRGTFIFRLLVLIVGVGLLAAIGVMCVQLFFGGAGANIFTWLIAAAMMVPLAVSQLRRAKADYHDDEARWYRLSRFATANGLSYLPSEQSPKLPVSVFRHGGSMVDILSSASPLTFQVSNYSYETTTARTRMPHTACLIAFESPAGAPPMTLVTRAGDVWGQPAVPPREQREMKLADDAMEHFRVYCEPQDEAAVRRIVTSEARAVVGELAGRCDIEITAGRIFIIARHQLSLTEPAFWNWLSDLSPLIETVWSPSARQPTAEEEDRWESHRIERASLFAPARSGKSFAIGCLIPAAIGFVAAAATARFG